jgi:hypothetical protein
MNILLKRLFGESWRTSLLGIVCILWGLRSAWVVWVPSQTLKFNLLYVLPGQISLIIVGWALLHARDQSAHDHGRK